MTATIGYATLSVIPSMKGALGNLQSELGGPLDDAGEKAGTSSSKKFGEKFSAGMKAAGAAIGVAAVGSFVKSAVGAASDVDESMSKVKVVFGESSTAVIDWSKNAATAMGQSQGQALGAVGTFGNLLKGFGVGTEQTTQMSEGMVQLASDLASFNNTSVDEALGALQSGLTGETEPLKKFGVAINDAALKQEALKLGLIATTDEAMSPAVKAQASYSLILASTATAQGDFARTSGGLANQQKILGARFEDVKAKIGAKLLPIFTKLASFVSDHLTPVLIGIGVVLGVLFIAWAAGAITAAAATIAAAAPFIAIGLVIAAVAAGVIYAYTHFEAFRTVVDAVASFFRDVVWPIIQTVATAIADAFMAMVGFIRDHWDEIKNVVETAINAVQVIIQTVVDVIQAAWKLFGDNILAAIQLVWDLISGVVQVGVDLVKGIVDTFIAIFTGDWQGAWDGVKAILQAVWDGIKLVVQTAIDALVLVLDTAWTAIKVAAGIAWDLIKLAVTAPIDAAKAAIGLVWDGIKSAADTAWSALKTAADTAWDLIKAAVMAPINLAKDALKTAWDTIKSDAQAVWDGMKAIVQVPIDAIKGFIQGLIDKVQFVIDKAEAARDALANLNPFASVDKLDATFTYPTHASGTSDFEGGPTWVGEQGPELAWLPRHTAILSHGPSMALAAGASGGGGGPQITLYNNRRDIGVADLNHVLAMARLAS